MDRGHAWHDYSLLNAAWSKAAARSNTDSTLLRFRVNSAKNLRSIIRSVKVLEHLALDYSLPWPLSFVFTPAILEIYTSIFRFLLQVRRAKHLVDRLSLVKPGSSTVPSLQVQQSSEHELKQFYSLRMRLSWIVGVLFDFIMISVLEREVERFRRVLEKTEIVDELISEALGNAQRMRDRALLSDSVRHQTPCCSVGLICSFADAADSSSARFDPGHLRVDCRRLVHPQLDWTVRILSSLVCLDSSATADLKASSSPSPKSTSRRRKLQLILLRSVRRRLRRRRDDYDRWRIRDDFVRVVRRRGILHPS